MKKKWFFGILLNLVIMLGILLGMSMTAYATDESIIAKIGDAEYTSLQDAVYAAQTGDTITLVRDAEATYFINLERK